MLLTRLVDSATGGASRVGGIVQQGIRAFKQVFHGDKFKAIPAQREAERSLAKASKSVRFNIVSHVRDGAKGIVSNYLARNQIHNLVSEMRSRYAFRLMSGPARFYGDFRGLSNRVAIYGFVGISLSAFIQNQHQNLENEGCIDNLFEGNLRKDGCHDNDCDDQRVSSDDSDITVLSDGENDDSRLEIVSNCDGSYLMVGKDGPVTAACYDLNSDEAVLLERESATSDDDDLFFVPPRVCQQNFILRHLATAKDEEDDFLSSLINEFYALSTMVETQQKELIALRETVARQTMMLSGQIKGAGKTEWRTGDRNGDRRNNICGRLTEMEMEELRARGGRVRQLKVHRKQRKKSE